MSEISALPSSIVEWLEGREDLDYIKFLTEFPPIKKAVPLKKTTVAVGIKGMKMSIPSLRMTMVCSSKTNTAARRR